MADLGKQLEAKFQAKEFDEVIKMTDQVPENHPARYVYKIKCYLATQKWDDVIAQANLGLEKTPAQKPMYCLMKAQAYNAQTHYNEAAENFGIAVDIMKDKADQAVLANYGNALMHSDPPQTEKAIHILEEAIKKDDKTPNAFIAQGNLATLYINSHQYAEALKLLEKAVLVQNPDKVKMAKQWLNKAVCEVNTNSLTEAKSSFQQARSLEPTLEGITSGLATLYYNEMIAFNQQQDHLKCVESSEEVLQLIVDDHDPRKLEALFCKANSKQALKQDGIIEAYLDVLKVDEKNIKAMNNLAVQYQIKSELEKAIQFYKQAAELEQNFILYSNLGEAYLALKQPNFELALDSFNKALQINPHAVLALTNRAQFYLKKQQKQQAMVDLKLVQELIADPKNVADLTKKKLDYIHESVHKILELEAAFEREKKAAQDQLAKLDQSDPEIIRIQQELANIQKEIDDQNAAELAQVSQKEQSSAPKISKDDVKRRIAELMNQAEQTQKKNEEKIVEIKIEQKKEDIKIERIEKKVSELEQCISIVGLDKVAKIHDNYAKWRTEYKDGYDYAKAFYWTFINYCDAQKIASTEIVDQVSGNAVGTTTKVAVKVATAVLDFGSSIPVFGAIFSAINSAIGAVYAEYEKFQDEYKRNAILEVIMKNQDADDKEGWSMLVAMAAQTIAERKRGYFAAGPVAKQKSTLDSVLDWVQDKIKAIKDIASGQKVDMYESWGGQEASQDIVILLAFIMKNHKEMTENTSQTLDVTIADIVYLEEGKVSPSFQSMLNTITKREEEEKHPKKQTEQTDSACTCQLI